MGGLSGNGEGHPDTKSTVGTQMRIVRTFENQKSVRLWWQAYDGPVIQVPPVRSGSNTMRGATRYLLL